MGTEVTVMTTQELFLASLVAATLAGAAVPAAARSNVELYVNFAPPPARYHYVPAPRAGFVWVPGYWHWRGHRHVWVRGHWLRHGPVYYRPIRYRY